MKVLLIISLVALLSMSCFREDKGFPSELWQIELGIDMEDAKSIMEIEGWEPKIEVGDTLFKEVYFRSHNEDNIVLIFENNKLIDTKVL